MSDYPPQDYEPLGRAKEWLRARVGAGARCPCCTQFAKVYRRKLHTSMALGLITMRKRGDDYQNINADVNLKAGDTAKLRYWGLIERDEERAGWYRVTDLGREFVANRATVLSHVVIYDDNVMGLEGKNITIRDALGERFDYEELMSA